jgi:hypothetical protein
MGHPSVQAVERAMNSESVISGPRRSGFPMVDVLRLRPLPNHRLWIRFTDGSEGVRDLSDLIAEGGPMVEPLRSPDYFARAFVEMGAPTWPNGFDLDPINLYMQMRDSGALTQPTAE